MLCNLGIRGGGYSEVVEHDSSWIWVIKFVPKR